MVTLGCYYCQISLPIINNDRLLENQNLVLEKKQRKNAETLI